MSVLNAKDSLRKILKGRRLTVKERDFKSVKIQSKLSEFISEYSNDDSSKLSILLYASTEAEVSTDAIVDLCLSKQHQVYFPLCHEGEIIPIRILNPATELVPKSFNIREPKQDLFNMKDRVGQPHKMDIIVVPGLGFDLTGNRIGYGKGFYDKFAVAAKGVVRVGLCFEDQIESSIPTEEFDQKVNLIITESRIIKISTAD